MSLPSEARPGTAGVPPAPTSGFRSEARPGTAPTSGFRSEARPGTAGVPPAPAAAFALTLALLAACATPPDVATYRVERRPFVHQVGAEGVLAAEKTTPLTVPPDVESTVRLAWLAAVGTSVESGDVVARFDRRPLEERLDDGRSELRGADLAGTRARSTGDSREAEIATDRQVAELELALAERYGKADEDLFSRHEILEARIDEELARERRRHAEGAAETQGRLSAAELAILEIKRTQARGRIAAAEKGLAALEVRAPHAGLFVPRKDWRGEPLEVGAEMWRGQPVGEIPDLATIEAEVYVLEADAGGVAVGQEAELVVESRPDRVFAARVRRVDAVAQPRFRGSPVQFFGVSLAIAEADPAAMKPGQRVRATLFVERRDDALVVPRQAVLRTGGKARVFVEDGEELVAREVELGASSRGLVVVTAGLAEGEVVALRPPDGADGATSDDRALAGGAARVEAGSAAPAAPAGSG